MPTSRKLHATSRYEPAARETTLHRLVARELESFLADAAGRGHALPHFVEQTFRNFLTCQDPAQGFIHLRCSGCGFERAVAFSCKRRGICSSCAGRRMNDVATHLVDNVLPPVPIRQWVLTLPYSLRYRLAYDRELLSAVLDAFIQALFASHRRRAKNRYQTKTRIQPGAVTFVQRFGGSINLNVHFHTLLLDGVYAVDAKAGTVEFLPLPAPSSNEVLAVLMDTAGRIARRLKDRGIGDNVAQEEADPLSRDNPLLAQLYAASVQGRVPDGERAGQPTARFGRPTEAQSGPPSAPSSSRSAVAAGMSLHAGVFVPGSDRQRLERICRYTARPAIATDRLEERRDGRLAYRLRSPWHDGTTHVVFEPKELMARLAAQIPPPRAHQVRYHGILAPAAGWRSSIVPQGKNRASDTTSKVPPEYRTRWSMLLQKVFAVDALACPRCKGRMRPIAIVTRSNEIEALLKRFGCTQQRPP